MREPDECEINRTSRGDYERDGRPAAFPQSHTVILAKEEGTGATKKKTFIDERRRGCVAEIAKERRATKQAERC